MVGAKAVEEVATHGAAANAKAIAGAWYHFKKPGGYQFKAWGKASKVYVPQAAGEITSFAKAASGVGWLYTDVELYHAIYVCSGRLSGE